jgi:hypothetical protein
MPLEPELRRRIVERKREDGSIDRWWVTVYGTVVDYQFEAANGYKERPDYRKWPPLPENWEEKQSG